MGQQLMSTDLGHKTELSANICKYFIWCGKTWKKHDSKNLYIAQNLLWVNVECPGMIILFGGNDPLGGEGSQSFPKYHKNLYVRSLHQIIMLVSNEMYLIHHLV